MTIDLLIVDPKNASHMKDSISNYEGYSITTIDDLNQATDAINKNDYNVLIIEPWCYEHSYNSPVVDFIKYVFNKKIPVVISSVANNKREIFQKFGLVKGFDYNLFLNKPYSSREILFPHLKKLLNP